MLLDPNGSEWGDLIERAQTAWRWEQQPVYASDLATGCPQRWRDGDNTPALYIAEFVASVVAPLVAEGRTRERVRVVDEPMTWFQEWADTQAEWNRAAGEPIHTIGRQTARVLGIEAMRDEDFWLLNDDTVVWLRFDRDGNLTAVEVDTDDDALHHARTVRDAAMNEVLANA